MKVSHGTLHTFDNIMLSQLQCDSFNDQYVDSRLADFLLCLHKKMIITSLMFALKH